MISTYIYDTEHDMLAYITDEGVIYKDKRNAPSEKVGYAIAGSKNLLLEFRDVWFVHAEPGVKRIGYITKEGRIYKEPEDHCIGSFRGSKIYDEKDRFIGQSSNGDPRSGAALLLGLFEKPAPKQEPATTLPANNQNSNTNQGGSSNSTQNGGYSSGGSGTKTENGGFLSWLLDKLLEMGCFGWMLLLLLFEAAVVVGVLPFLLIASTYSATLSELGEGVIKWAKASVIFIFPAIFALIIFLTSFAGRHESRKNERVCAIVSISFIVVLSILLSFMLPYVWEHVWVLWKFNNPASVPFFIAWGIRLAYAIFLSIMIRKSFWEVKYIRRFNGLTGVLMILQILMWCIITRAYEETEIVMLAGPVTALLWLITNIPVFYAVKKS